MKDPKWVVFDFSGTLYYFEDRPVKEMWELANELKSAGYRLAICTNISLSDRKNLPRFDIFDKIIDFEVHQTKKPDPKVYKSVEKELNSTGEKIFYIDDMYIYTKEAQKYGWQTYTFEIPSNPKPIIKPIDKCVEELKNILLT
jgi:HAD superfamily hydrolase (TIGR01509 family)